jgi:hypothetical protein
MCTENQHQQILHTKNNFKQHEHKSINQEYVDAIQKLEISAHACFTSNHGLMSYTDTKAFVGFSQKLTCRKIFRH